MHGFLAVAGHYRSDWTGTAGAYDNYLWTELNLAFQSFYPALVQDSDADDITALLLWSRSRVSERA